jgi:predicted nucleotidyltransferase component of viral defense system
MKKSRNLAASIRQQLLNRAREQKRPFNEVLQYYAMERFLYRLSQSRHAERFILKGALMLRVWQAPEARPTMDIDMLGRTSNEADSIVMQIREVLATEVVADGLIFDEASVQAETITQDADYQGIRLRWIGDLSGARVILQLDIGFGDSVVPSPKKAQFPTILDLPAPHLLCYSRESAIAEKLEAMVKLGDLNSRMKDFYDIWLLARCFNFNSEELAEAVHQTFTQRATPLPDKSPFTEAFVSLKQVQWNAFCKRLPAGQAPKQFIDVVELISSFLSPFLDSDKETRPRAVRYWLAPGPWQPS